MFTYQLPSTKPTSTKRTISVPLNSNDLFILQTNDDFTSFIHCTPTYLKGFKNFVGAGHIISVDDSSATTEQTRENNYDAAYQSMDKSRKAISRSSKHRSRRIYGETRMTPPTNNKTKGATSYSEEHERVASYTLFSTMCNPL